MFVSYLRKEAGGWPEISHANTAGPASFPEKSSGQNLRGIGTRWLSRGRPDAISSRMKKQLPEAAEPPPPEPGKPAEEKPPQPREIGGPKGPEPTRYGDWEIGGRCSDF